MCSSDLGIKVEDSFHAAVECTKARALRHRMREVWDLPKEKSFRKVGNDWLLILLNNAPKRQHKPKQLPDYLERTAKFS